MEGFLLVVSGASGTGKGAILQEFVKRVPKCKYSVSATTREPREGEIDGVSYFFLDEQTFQVMADSDEFLEYALVHCNYYGTPRKYVEEEISNGNVVILEIDVQGADNIINKYAEAVSVFVLPPSLEELERRLRNRGTETEEKIRIRMKNAKKELSKVKEYDYVIVNDDLKESIADLEAIVRSERLKTTRNKITIR